MLATALLLAALLPEAHAMEEMSLNYGQVKVSYGTRSSEYPDSLDIAFSAPDSRTVALHVAADDDEFQTFEFVYGEPEFDSARLWWSLCLEGACPEIVAGITERTSNLVYSGESGGLNASDSDWKYIPIRRFPK